VPGQTPEVPAASWQDSLVLTVLHLRNSDRFGGPERLILDQVLLAAPDVRHVVASFGREGRPHPFLEALREAGVETRLVRQRGSYDLRLKRRTKAVVRAVDPDVLVGHDYKASLLVRATRHRPRVGFVHGYTAENRKIRVFEAMDRRGLKRMDAVVVVARRLRAVVLAAGVAPERVHVVENGVRADRVREAAAAGREVLRHAWGFTAGDVVLLGLGRLSPEKGYDVLLEAVAALSRDLAVRLVLVGDGAARGDLERRARGSDLAGRVRFLGWRDDPWACLGAADMLVQPSRREGLPVALLEAMAVGLPVVATRVGAVGEVLDDGHVGRLVEPGDAGALAHAIGDLVADATDRRALGERARERVDAHYDAATQTRRLETIYRDLVG
jgi:glycosyltransferase involved in cell wall biosynthesis